MYVWSTSTYLEELLQHIVAEHVSHEEVGRGDDLVEDQLLVHIRAHLRVQGEKGGRVSAGDDRSALQGQ